MHSNETIDDIDEFDEKAKANSCKECGGLPYHSFDTERMCCIYSYDSPVHNKPVRYRSN